MITPVILSGGTGSRLWPSSRALYPKQLLALTSEKSMLQETVLRIKDLNQVNQPIVICNEAHRFIIAEQLQQIGITNAQLILEPTGRNTAPAALIAALYAKGQSSSSTLLILPADHLIQDTASFQQLVTTGLALASQGSLVTFGIKPTQAETGYGYIKMGKATSQNAFLIEKFVEKPNQETAQHYIHEGNYLWNSGIFMFGAEQYIQEIKTHEPNMLSACEKSLSAAKQDLDFLRLDKETFEACPANSIDYAIMEKTHSGVVLPFNGQWNDLGSWTALWDIHAKDQNNNVIYGDVLTHNVSDSYIRAESKLIAALGIQNQIIVETEDAILIADKNKAQDVKHIVKQLEDKNRQEHYTHKIVYRPWGNYQILDAGKRFQVKRICVKPKVKLSLQMHQHRAEHWIVVTGTATVTRNQECFLLQENESTYIPVGSKHRLENSTDTMLEVIEVQSGNYLGEDDIIRFEDDYQRE